MLVVFDNEFTYLGKFYPYEYLTKFIFDIPVANHWIYTYDENPLFNTGWTRRHYRISRVSEVNVPKELKAKLLLYI